MCGSTIYPVYGDLFKKMKYVAFLVKPEDNHQLCVFPSSTLLISRPIYLTLHCELVRPLPLQPKRQYVRKKEKPCIVTLPNGTMFDNFL